MLGRGTSFRNAASDIYRNRLGEPVVDRGEGFALVNYSKGGKIDLEAYRAIQTVANKAKINMRYASEANIAALVDWLQAQGVSLNRVLCHGTRNAAEQIYFRHKLPEAEIIGTEISDNADQFPMTIQWDFHETKPEWIGYFDLIYSNSWDHTYDPAKLFPAWHSCVAPGGVLALEWGQTHTAEFTDVVDPFGADLETLVRMLQHHAGDGFAEPEIFDGLPERDLGHLMVTMRRHRPAR